MVFKNQEDLPKQCPPADAASKDIYPVYRFIENNIVQAIDFLNHKERNKPYPHGMISYSCESFALSFFTSEEAAKKMAKKYPFFKKKNLVSGKITSKCGVHKTEREHLNLWLYKNVDMLKIFLGKEN